MTAHNGFVIREENVIVSVHQELSIAMSSQLFFSALVFLTLAFSPLELFAQNRAKIVIGHASMSSVVLTLWAAQDRGFFAKNGIDAQMVFIPGSPTLIASLNTGDVHFGFTGGTATLGAAVARTRCQDDRGVRRSGTERARDPTRDQDRRGSERQTHRRDQYRRHRLDVGDAGPRTDRH